VITNEEGQRGEQKKKMHRVAYAMHVGFNVWVWKSNNPISLRAIKVKTGRNISIQLSKRIAIVKKFLERWWGSIEDEDECWIIISMI